jgi:hypothetical protein
VPDHGHVLLVVDQRGEALGDDLVVLDYEHACDIVLHERLLITLDSASGSVFEDVDAASDSARASSSLPLFGSPCA